MNCESCLNQHDGTYGSGRFCSMHCSKSFSSLKNRKEINEKIRQKLTLPPKEKVCSQCSSTFLTKRKHRKFCSKTCSAANINANPKSRQRYERPV